MVDRVLLVYMGKHPYRRSRYLVLRDEKNVFSHGFWGANGSTWSKSSKKSWTVIKKLCSIIGAKSGQNATTRFRCAPHVFYVLDVLQRPRKNKKSSPKGTRERPKK